LLSTVQDGDIYFSCFDANGNITDYVDETGEIAAHYEYNPFGGITSATGDKRGDFNFRFSTKYLDTETELYYYGYRYYSTELGRWINRDPIGIKGGLNPYGFVGNGSVDRFDLWGLAQQCTLATDYHHVGIMAILHHFVGRPDDFGRFRRTFFNYFDFPVNCLTCQIGSGPTVRVTNENTSQVAGIDIDVERDFQIITWNPGTCTENGAARLSVSTTLILHLQAGHGDHSWNYMVDISADLEVCYDCVSCK